MPSSGYGGWWCCCQEGCWNYIDCWTDPHNACLPDLPCRTKLGPHWKIKSPSQPSPPDPKTWWIYPVLYPNFQTYCHLFENGNPGAFLLCQDAVPRGKDNHVDSGSYSHFMSASIGAGAIDGMRVGDSYGLILEYTQTAGGENYIEIKATQISDDRALLEIYQVVESGTPQKLKECEFHNTIHPNVRGFQIGGCVSKGMLYATATALFGTLLAIPDPGPPEEDKIIRGWRAGFKHYLNRLAMFDNWRLNQTVDDQAELCPACGICACQEPDIEGEQGPIEGRRKEPISGKLLLTFIAEGDCSTLDGVTVELKLQSCSDAGTSWYGVIKEGCLAPYVDSMGGIWAYTVRLSCPSPESLEGPTDFWLTLNAASTWDVELFGPAPEGAGSLLIQPHDCPCLDPWMPHPFGWELQPTTESSCFPFVLVYNHSYTVDNLQGETVISGNCKDACEPCGGHPSGGPPPAADCTEVYPGESKTVSFRIVIIE